MAFTRAFLKSAGATEEQITAIMEEYVSMKTAMQAQIDQYKADAEKHKAEAEQLAQAQKELESLKARKDYKAEYEQAKKDLDDYKLQVQQEAELEKVRAAYKKLLADESIDEKRHAGIMRITDFSGMKLNEDGTLENADALKSAIGTEWGEYRVRTRQRGENVAHPPMPDKGEPVSPIRQMTEKWHEERYGKPND